MPDPVRNWRQPFTELHPDLKKEIQFLRRGDGEHHYCMIHPDMIERHNAQLFNHHQLEAFRQAVEDVRIELGMNAVIDTSSVFTEDGRPILVVQLYHHEAHPGTLPEPYPGEEAAAQEKAGIIVDERGQTLSPILPPPKEDEEEELIIQ